MKRQDSQIYIYNHKPLEYGVWDNELYTPIEVGAELREPFMEQLRDNDNPDNISYLNPVYLEQTGLYYIWKHCHPEEFKGVTQYRRRLEFPEDFDFETIFKEYDAIATVPLYFNVRQQYINCHSFTDLKYLERVIKDNYPDYSEAWDRYIAAGTKLYYSNGLIMRTEDLDAYCEWIFDVLSKFMEARCWNSVEDTRKTVREEIANGVRCSTKGEDYQMEIGAFISERLMTMYLLRNCRIKEVPYNKYENILI